MFFKNVTATGHILFLLSRYSDCWSVQWYCCMRVHRQYRKFILTHYLWQIDQEHGTMAGALAIADGLSETADDQGLKRKLSSDGYACVHFAGSLRAFIRDHKV